MKQPINLDEVAAILRASPRLGGAVDDPEGTRYIQLSDTLAGYLADVIDEYLEDHRYD